MRKIKIILRIFYSYIVIGLFNLGLVSIYIFLRDGYFNSKLLSPVSTIILWPISSLPSAYVIFGDKRGKIWSYFSIAGTVLFVLLMIDLFRKEKKRR